MESLNTLVEWAEKEGAWVNKTAIRIGYQRESGFGWYARTELPPRNPSVVKPSDVLVKVPRRLALTIESLKDTHLAPLLMIPTPERWSSYRERLFLAAYLLTCRFQANCFWHPYAKALPLEVENPLTLSPEELEPFKAFRVVQAISGIRHGLAEMHSYLVGQLDLLEIPVPEGRLTLANFLWGWWIVGARSLVRDGVTAIVPLVDLFNYRRNESAPIYDGNRKVYAALNHIQGAAKGEQVFVGYSANFTDLNSWGWYSWTGYAPEDIALVIESFPFAVRLADLLNSTLPGIDAEARQALIEPMYAAANALGYEGGFVISPFRGDLDVPKELHPLLRVASALNQEELDWIVTNKGANPQESIERLRHDQRALGVLSDWFNNQYMLRASTDFSRALSERYGRDDEAPDRVKSLIRLLKIELKIVERYRSHLLTATKNSEVKIQAYHEARAAERQKQE